MNTEAMLAVADVIEHFNRVNLFVYAATDKHAPVQRSVKPTQLWEDCGTVGCIAGWTCAWADVNKTGGETTYYNAAKRELDLTYEQAYRLFGGRGGFWEDHLGDDESKWNGRKVAAMLRKIARGKIDL